MSKRALFYFIENDKDYILTNSLGEGVWRAWGKDKFTLESALRHSDSNVGEYVRQYTPKETKYIITLKEK